MTHDLGFKRRLDLSPFQLVPVDAAEEHVRRDGVFSTVRRHAAQTTSRVLHQELQMGHTDITSCPRHQLGRNWINGTDVSDYRARLLTITTLTLGNVVIINILFIVKSVYFYDHHNATAAKVTKAVIILRKHVKD